MSLDYNSMMGNKKYMMTIIGIVGKHPTRGMLILCKCDCGNEKEVEYNHFRRGHNKSCGCKQNPKIVEYDWKHPLYKILAGIKDRCINPNNSSYDDYGAKGVAVCDEWKNDYQLFYDWCMANGWKKELRVDKDIIPKRLGIPALLYSPEMCSIVTQAENCQTRGTVILDAQKVVEIRKSTLTANELAEIYGVSDATIRRTRNKKMWANI